MINKLRKIQAELKAPKGQVNNFGKYRYRSCEDILEAVKPLLNKHELFLSISDELVNIGERYYVKAIVKVTDSENVNGITVEAYAREEESKKGMDGSQITGAASSYARKYALNGLFLIDDTKDSDATNKHGKEVKPAGSEVEREAKELMKVKLKTMEGINHFLESKKLPEIKKCTDKEFSMIIDILNGAE